MNIYALDMAFKELEKPSFVTRMLKMVDASEDNPAYVFVVLGNGVGRQAAMMARYSPLRIDPSAAPAIGEPCGPTQ